MQPLAGRRRADLDQRALARLGTQLAGDRIEIGLGQVPFVHHHQRGALGPRRRIHRPEVGVGQTLGRVADDQRDVAALGRLDRPYLAVVLDVVAHPAALAHPGGVGEHDLAALVFEQRVDGIPRGARSFVDDHAHLAQQRVEDRALADVRATHDAQGRDALLARQDRLRLGQCGHHHVEQVPDPEPVLGGDRHDLPQAEPPEPLRQQFGLAPLALVGDHDDRHPRGAQVVGHLEVARGRGRGRVHDEQDQVRVGDRLARLRAHLAADRRRIRGIDAAGVDDLELRAHPIRRPPGAGRG